MASLFDYSQTAGSNATVGSVNFAEGQTAGSVNNSARQLMADIAKWRDDIGGKTTTTGSANAQVLTTSSTITSLADGQFFGWVAGYTNTGNTTLNVDTLGAKKVLRILSDGSESEIQAGDIAAGGHYWTRYDASADSAAGAWILINPALISKADNGLVIGTDVQAYNAALAAVAGGTRVSFSAHNNNVNQGAIISDTKVEFDTELWDQGSHYDAATNFRWTPPSGKYRISASVYITSTSSGFNNYIAIYKNGLLFRRAAHAVQDENGEAFSGPLNITSLVEANGTDYFEIFIEVNANCSINGTTSLTWFEGEAV